MGMAGRTGSAGQAAPAGPGSGGAGWLSALREGLREELLGDSVLEPAWVPGLAVFVLMDGGPHALRAGRDPVDVEVVRRYPTAAGYYLWKAARRASEQGLAVRRAMLVVPGDPAVQALWEAPDGESLPAQGTAREKAGGSSPGSFDPVAAVSEVQVWVDGQRWRSQAAHWAQAAEMLAADGDRWLERFRGYGSLGSLPDAAPLVRAQRLYQAALELYPGHNRARDQLALVEQRLQAVALFGRAQRLAEEHERALREAERRHDELAVTRHSYYLWKATELLEQSLQLDRGLLGAAAALDRLRRALGDRPKPPYETAAQLEAELRESYVRQSAELDYEQARRAAETVRGSRVHLRGQVLQWLESRAPVSVAVTVALVGTGERPVVYVELPRHLWEQPERGPEGQGQAGAEASNGGDRGGRLALGIAAGSIVDVWGELAGSVRYRDPGSGRVVTVPRVMAAYVEPVQGSAQGQRPGQGQTQGSVQGHGPGQGGSGG